MIIFILIPNPICDCFVCVFSMLLCDPNTHQFNSCLDKTIVQPPENPFICHHSNANNDSFVIECCKEFDQCNKDLRPLLHVRKEGMFFR